FTVPREVVVVDRCAQPSTMDVYLAADGHRVNRLPAPQSMQPVGCTVGRQGCTGVAGPGGGWLIGEDGGVAPAPYLTGPGTRPTSSTGTSRGYPDTCTRPTGSWRSSGCCPGDGPTRRTASTTTRSRRCSSRGVERCLGGGEELVVLLRGTDGHPYPLGERAD